MELRPLKQYHEPKLPTRQIIDEYPELLRLIPRRWQTNPIVLSALAGVCTLMLGSRALATDQSASVSKVAPVFEHGEGRASFGGMTGDRRTFLSEEEARKIIQDEASKASLFFTADSSGVGGLDVPRPDHSGFLPVVENAEAEQEKQQTETSTEGHRVTVNISEHMEHMRKEEGPLKELVFDGVDKRLNISYEYVSEYDFKQWATRYPKCSSTVRSYDLRSTANALQQSLAVRKPEGVCVVFYDPLVSARSFEKARSDSESGKLLSFDQRKTNYELAQQDAMQAGREELRKQVQDFIKWLKTQGVI